MIEELVRIKRIYGEEMMHLCRELFPTILEEQGTLLNILKNTFGPSHRIAKDIRDNDYTEDFRRLIYVKYYAEKEDKKEEIELPVENRYIKTPQELLKEHGYTLYECHSEEDIQAFKHYYANGEELCTFLGDRLDTDYVFFAVKDNIDEYNRDDYTNPQREDPYSTSLLSIQFGKGINWNPVSIKSRYNHRVVNPDATYGNDLDEIVPGLAESFSHHYHFKLIPTNKNASFLYNMKYTATKDGKFYRYNHEKNGIFYCENNLIVSHGRLIDYYKDKERYIFMDEFILDRQRKIILGNQKQGFIKTTMLDDEIIKTEYVKVDDYNAIVIHFKDNKAVMIGTNKDGEIVYYGNPFAKRVYEKFLPYNNKMRIIEIPKVRRIERMFMTANDSLVKLDAPLVRDIFYDFLSYNSTLSEFNVTQLRRAGDRFLIRNPNFDKKELLKQCAPKERTIRTQLFVLQKNRLYEYHKKKPHMREVML